MVYEMIIGHDIHGDVQAALAEAGISWSWQRVPDGRTLYAIGDEVLTAREVKARYIDGEPVPEKGACRCWSITMHIGLHDGHCCFRKDEECHADPRPAASRGA